MSFLHGAISASRFLVDGPEPAVFEDAFLDGIHARRFDDTRELGDGEANIGFVVAGKLFESEIGLDDVLVNQFIRLGVRIETKTVPVTLLHAHCQIAFRTNTTPWQLDLTKKKKDGELIEMKGICLLKDNTLKLSIGEPGKDRPTSFDDPGSTADYTVITATRMTNNK